MHLSHVTNAREERVPEEPMHDVKEGVEHPHLLRVRKRLLNKVWHELVLVGRVSVGVRVNSNWRIESFIENKEQLHELLPGSRQLSTIGHPSHGPLFIDAEVDRSKELCNDLWIKVLVEGENVFNAELLHKIKASPKYPWCFSCLM